MRVTDTVYTRTMVVGTGVGGTTKTPLLSVTTSDGSIITFPTFEEVQNAQVGDVARAVPVAGDATGKLYKLVLVAP